MYEGDRRRRQMSSLRPCGQGKEEVSVEDRLSRATVPQEWKVEFGIGVTCRKHARAGCPFFELREVYLNFSTSPRRRRRRRTLPSFHPSLRYFAFEHVLRRRDERNEVEGQEVLSLQENFVERITVCFSLRGH